MSSVKLAAVDQHCSYIFWWHNFFELVQSEFLFPFSNILSEHRFQPGDVLLVKNASFSINDLLKLAVNGHK